MKVKVKSCNFVTYLVFILTFASQERQKYMGHGVRNANKSDSVHGDNEL